MKERKPLIWIGSSKRDLLDLNRDVQKMIGHSLNLAQRELKDPDCKPLSGFGNASILEIVKNDPNGTYRAIYTVKYKEAIYVLHVFQKKSKSGIKTPKQDIDLIKSRLKDAHQIHLMMDKKG